MLDENKINDSTGTGSGIDIGTINTPSQQTNTL
jgi:hypothetical protein